MGERKDVKFVRIRKVATFIWMKQNGCFCFLVKNMMLLYLYF